MGNRKHYLFDLFFVKYNYTGIPYIEYTRSRHGLDQ